MEQLKTIAAKALDALKAEGADKAKCDVGYSVTHEFNVDGGAFSLFRTLFDKHLVLTSLQGGKKGTVRQNRYDDETVMALAKNCLETGSSAVPDDAWDIAPQSQPQDFVYGAVTPNNEKLFFRCQELMEDIRTRYPKILMEQMIVSHKAYHTVHANTNGVLYGETCGYYEISLMYSAHEGEKASSFFGGGFTTYNLDTPFIECASVAKDLEDVEKQIDTVSVEGKFEGVMLLPPSSLSSFLYYVLSNFVSDSSILQGTSPWKASLGQKVADERINLSASPLDGRIVCGERVTDDGYLAENYDIIKGGVLEQLMLSQYVANKTGNKRAPNGSYSLVMAAGDTPLHEMIAGIDRGIVVGRFSGGEPSSNGDFSGVAKNSFLIEKGKIVGALSETMISGNLAEMLNRLVAISREQVADGAMVLPYAAFGGITVSGK